MATNTWQVPPERLPLLSDDLIAVREAVLAAGAYSFAGDVGARKQAQGLSASEIARRCDVSHSAVNKWLHGKARPGGKENMKKLGMALGMDEAGLDEFLLNNGYPRLYSKSPLDTVCLWVLQRAAGQADVVELYEAEVKAYNAAQMPVPASRVTVRTTHLAQSLARVKSAEEFREWLGESKKSVAATDKTVLPRHELRRFVKLFLAGRPLDGLCKAGDIPQPLYEVLGKITGEKRTPKKGERRRPVNTRDLREKLIVFGLSCNMTDEDMARLLAMARVAGLLQTGAQTDTAIQVAMNRAHMRFPCYEFDYLSERHQDLVDILSRRVIVNGPPLPMEQALRAEYHKRLPGAEAATLYYDLHRGEEEQAFEKAYTDYDDNNGKLLHYVRDILTLLAQQQVLPKQEVDDFVALTWPP